MNCKKSSGNTLHSVESAGISEMQRPGESFKGFLRSTVIRGMSEIHFACLREERRTQCALLRAFGVLIFPFLGCSLVIFFLFLTRNRTPVD